MTTSSALKFGQFVDLMMARLLERERETPSGVLLDLNEVARELKVSVPDQWIFDAGKVMDGRGWAQVAFTFGGGCHARLTGEGRLYVEEERGTGIIRDYHEAPAQFISVSGTGNQVIAGNTTGGISHVVGIERERAPAFRLVGQLKKTLQDDPSLSDSDREDLLTDIQMVEQQLRKREPNRAVLAALLEPLSRVASIGGFVADLVRLLNP
jgi:hypothetical protein